MSNYPRDLLITEDVIRDFEELVGVRFINKTECAKALAKHDARVKAEAFDEFVAFANEMPTVEDEDGYIRPMWLEEMAEKLKEQMNDK